MAAPKKSELQFNLVDGVTKVLRGIGSGLSGLNQQFANLNQTVELGQKALAALGDGFGLGSSLKEAGQLEDILARVQLKTGATADEMDGLEAAVSRALGNTRFTGEQAAQGLATLAESGLDATDAAQQLGNVLAFAQANALGASDAAGGLADTLDQFGEPAAKIGAIADALTAVATKAGTSGKQLQDGLLATGVAAEQAGLGVEQTVAALGALATAGIEGGKAGQRLQLLLQQLADPATKAGEALRALGLDASDFTGVLAKLGTDSAAAETVLAALGQRPRQALQALLQDGGGALAQFNQIVRDSGGASQEAADKLNRTFLGSLARISAAYQQAKDVFLAPLLPQLADEVNNAADAIRAFIQTADFKAVSQQFSDFVIKGVREFRQFVETLDFDAIVQSIKKFAGAAGAALENISFLLGKAADALRFLVSIPSRVASAVNEVVNSNAKMAAALEEARLKQEAANQTQAAAKIALDATSASTRAATDQSLRYGESTTTAGDAAAAAAPQIDKLSEAAGKLKFGDIADEVLQFGEGLLKAIPGLSAGADAGKEAAKALSDTAESGKAAVQAFNDLAAAGTASADELTRAFAKAVVGAQTKEELYTLQLQFNRLGADGRIALEDIGTASQLIAEKLSQLAQDALPSLEQAFKDLGITSQAELDKTAVKGRNAFDAIVKAAQDGTTAVEDIRRAFEAYAKQQLAAVAGADEYKRAQVEALLRVQAETLGLKDSLEELGLVSEQATGKLAAGADRAAQALGGARDVVEQTARAADDLSTASSSAAGSITQVEQSAAAATGNVSALSQAFQDASAQAVGFGLSQDGLREQVAQQTEEYSRYRDTLLETIRANDPLEQSIERLTRRFPAMSAAGIRALAELEQRAEQSAKRIDEVAKRSEASSSFGGGSPNGPGGGNPNGPAGGNPNGPGGGNPNGPGGGGGGQQQAAPQIVNNINVNGDIDLQTEQGLERFVRRITAVQRRIGANSL